MSKINQLLTLSAVLALASNLISIGSANANTVLVNQLGEGFQNEAIYDAFLIGEDLNQDNIISLDEVSRFEVNFSGNSEIDPFSLSSDNLALSQSSFGTYSYGISVLDTSDDLALNYDVFVEDISNNLFIGIQSDDDYSEPSSGTTIITSYTDNSFSIVDSSTTTSQALQLTVTSVPEPSTILGLLVVSSIGTLVRCKKG